MSTFWILQGRPFLYTSSNGSISPHTVLVLGPPVWELSRVKVKESDTGFDCGRVPRFPRSVQNSFIKTQNFNRHLFNVYLLVLD